MSLYPLNFAKKKKITNGNPDYTLKSNGGIIFFRLAACYLDKERTEYNPIIMYNVVTYANMQE